MKNTPAKGVTTPGFDGSHYDETINFGEVVAAGIKFCSSKTTEGTGVVDDRYKQNKTKAKAVNLLFGGYHFWRPGSDPIKQADFFLKHLDPQPGDLQPMFDWEVFQGKADIEKARKFIQKVETAVGKQMLIYGPPYALNDLGLDSWFAERPLWLAHYGTMSPLLPAPWKYWTFHQYSEKGSIPGIPAPDEDMDRFNGPEENLKKLIL